MKIPKLHKMKFMVLIFIFGVLSFIEAGLLQFRPLSAQQVYNALRAAKREDAIPQGRVITQGIAAMSGFAAGIATGIGVPLVFNIDLANVTGITALLSGNSGSSSGSSSQTQTQEICFNSRAANEIDDSDGVGEDEDAGVVLAENESGRSYQPLRSKKRFGVREARALRQSRAHYDDDDEAYENEVAESETVADENYDDAEQHNELPTAEAVRQADTSPTTPTAATTATGTATSPTTGETTQATSPGATDTQTNTGTTGDAGSGTGTNSETTTVTGTGGAVNCVVIQKPLSG